MNKIKRPLALLCALLLLVLAGCGRETPATEPTETESVATEPVTTEPLPTDPPAEDIYAAAREELEGRDAVTLAVSMVKTVTVADQVFTEASEQTLSYAGLGTDAMMVSLEEKLTYNIHDQDEEETEEEEFLTYKEIFAGGMVYAALEDTYFFSGATADGGAAERYLPVVLLDAALYESITAEASGGDTVLTFGAPALAEAWAVPEDAQLLDASGSAAVDGSGVLKQMNYVVTYQYGPAEIRLEVEAVPQTDAAQILVPEDKDSYTQLQNVDALRQYIRVAGMVVQADSLSTSSMESIFCQAAGVVRNQSVSMDVHGEEEDLITKIETGLYFMDYSSNQEQEMDLEETYRDGKYVSVVDNGVPTSHSGISYENVSEYCYQILISQMVDPEYWQDATGEDLGSVYLLELTFTQDFGDSVQNSICDLFWEDAAFLNKLASSYLTIETTGYLAFDKYTGLPTAAGYYYEGVHVIDGMQYTLSLQADQSIEAPAVGAYYAITEEMPEEVEPENKATPLFYHVTGAEGQEMWLFGTIHVGDERTAYLPSEIYDAFAASDALALEVDSEKFDEQMEEDDQLQEQVSDAYFYTNGKTLESQVEEEFYTAAVKYMKATGNYNMNMPYAKPYLWSNSIDNFYLRQGYQLHGDQGVEERLTAWAKELEKEIREVESSLFQIQMLTGYSDELQILMLEESMESTAIENWEGTWDLYEKWCQGDEAVLREEINEEVDTSELTEEELAEYEAQLPLYEEYYKAMSTDRNEGMLKVAVDYLESGEVVFYAVGLAHLLDDTNGLVDALREAGYTVELVEYAQ